LIGWFGFGFMIFNATFNNISVILWQSALLVEETLCPEKTTYLPKVTEQTCCIPRHDLDLNSQH
jgi:hypothetical protein